MNWNFFRRLAALEAKQARNDADISKMLDAMTGMLDYTNKVEDRVDSLKTEVGQIDADMGRVARILRDIQMGPNLPKPPKLTEQQLKARLAYLKKKAAATKDAS
jgi:hypothetical protein